VGVLRLGSRDPSSAKFGTTSFVGAGFAILVVAATLAANGVKVAPYWLVVTYLLHTFGELSLSPVGLSATTKLAPARVGGLMMGVWFLGISVGNFFGGRLSSLYGSMPLPQLFGAIGVVGIVSGLGMFALTPPIKRLMGEVN
jgi:POT family proton-dependent oligopeptide transporter